MIFKTLYFFNDWFYILYWIFNDSGSHHLFQPCFDLFFVFTGKQILHNFLFDICGLNASFTLQKREQQCIDYIRRVVGTEKVVLMLVSGGVDSAVCAALLHKALREGEDTSRVQAIHIDNGFLRKEESDQVVNSLQELGLNLRVTHLFFYNIRAAIFF